METHAIAVMVCSPTLRLTTKPARPLAPGTRRKSAAVTTPKVASTSASGTRHHPRSPQPPSSKSVTTCRKAATAAPRTRPSSTEPATPTPAARASSPASDTASPKASTSPLCRARNAPATPRWPRRPRRKPSARATIPVLATSASTAVRPGSGTSTRRTPPRWTPRVCRYPSTWRTWLLSKPTPQVWCRQRERGKRNFISGMGRAPLLRLIFLFSREA